MRLFLYLLLIPLGALAQNTYNYSSPKELNDGWPTSSLQKEKMDTKRVYQLFNQLGPAKHKIHSALLVYKGKLILEEYFDDQSVNTQHDQRSATKSVRSILTGIAIDKGYIKSIDDPISDYLGELKPKKNLDPRKSKITIRHLLTMSTGLDCNDWNPRSAGQEDRVYKKKDWLQYTLDLPMINEPGDVSSYCSMGVVLLVEVISRAAGIPIDEFANKYLFEPLGVVNISWGHTSSKKVIPSAKRLYMTARDMAKIGQLVINEGKWEGKQIVSEKWIGLSTRVHTEIEGMSYGFLWWKIPFLANGSAKVATVATGNGGQYILIFPELKTVMAFTGGAYNSAEDKLPFAIVKDIFIPTLESRK